MNTFPKFSLAPMIWVLALAGFIFFFRLGERPFRNPDEGRYAEIAHEMVASGDWVKPTLFGLGYLRKPPLFYWLTAASFKLFGENEFSARVIPALFGLFGILVVFWFGSRFFDHDRAFYAALILGTNLWYVQVARYLIIDAVYSFFLTAALFLFYAAAQPIGRKNATPVLFFASLACAFLTKGLSALVIVGIPAAIYLSWQRRWKLFFGRFAWIGLGLFFLMVLPWFVLMAHQEPGFLNFFFLHEHVQRFVAANFEHQEPWFYYLLTFPLLWLPWSLYRRSWVGGEPNDARRFLWLTISVIVVFFSFSRSKLPTYILPCVPLMALLTADSWKRWIDSKSAPAFSDYFPILLLCFLSLSLIVGAPIFLQRQAEKYPPALAGDLQFLGGAVLAGGVFSAKSLQRGQTKRFFFSLIALMTVVSLCVPKVMETVNPEYSNKSFVDKLRVSLTSQEEVFIFDHPGPFYDVEFYLKRPVKLVGLEGELEHSRQDLKAAEVSVSREEFFSRIRQQRPFVAFMRKSDFLEMDASLRANLRLLKQNKRKVLVRSASGTMAIS